MISILIFSSLSFGQVPYSSRPNILKLSPKGERFTAAEGKLAESFLRFLAEILAIYPEHKVILLARDCESMLDLALVLGQFYPDLFERVQMINVSRLSVQDRNLKKYLKQENVFSASNLEVVLVDTGYEGSIPEAIWKLAGKEAVKIKAHMVSSVHRKIPSSRVATRPYASDLSDMNQWAVDAGHQVEDLEDKLPHYMNQSATYYQQVGQRLEAMVQLDASYLETPEVENALRYMKALKLWAESAATRSKFLGLYASMNSVVERLDETTPISESEAKALLLGLKKNNAEEFLIDLLETEWKSKTKKRTGQLASLIYSGQQTLPEREDDIHEDYLEELEDTDLAPHWLSKDLDQTAKNLQKILTKSEKEGSNAIEFALSIPWPELWVASAALALEQKSKTAISKIVKHDHFPYLPPNLRQQLDLEKTPNLRPVVGRQALTMNDLVTLKKNLKQEDAKLRFRSAFSALDKAKRENKCVVTSKGCRPLIKKIGEGTHADFYSSEKGLGYKLPAEASDISSFVIEKHVYDFILASDFDIPLAPITAAGRDNEYFEKPNYSGLLGPDVLKRGKLSAAQTKNLEKIFWEARRFADETGIGLDLKADNLAWVDNKWVLIEAGPRMSFAQYAFTLELENFDAYQLIWQKEDADREIMSVDDWREGRFKKNLSLERELCSARLGPADLKK